MKRAILLLTLLGMFACVFSQAPGHLGRRWMIGLNAGISPVLDARPIFLGDMNSSQILAKSALVTPELKLGFAFARNGMLSASVRQTTGFGERRLYFPAANPGFINYRDNQPYHFRVRAYTLAYQNFMFKSAGKLAPNGLYFKALVGMWVAKGFQDDLSAGESSDFEQPSRTYLFAPGLGYNFLVTDFLILELGFEGIVTLPIIKGSESMQNELEFVTQNQAIRTHLGLNFLFGGGKWR